MFSISVLAETVSGYELEPDKIEEEKIEEQLVESEDELIASTAEIQNMEVVYELLEYDLSEEEAKVEIEEEFIINDLDEKVLDLEVIGSKRWKLRKKINMPLILVYPFLMPTRFRPKKIVHTLSDGEEQEIKEDSSLSEAIDFEFELVEKLEEVPVSEMKDVLSSPHDDSPFDKKIKETATKENEERKEHLKKFNHAFKHSMSKIDEFEKQPPIKEWVSS